VDREWKSVNRERIAISNFKYNNKPERKARLKSYRQIEDNKIRERASGKKYRERNPEVAKNGHLLRNFNITLEEYNSLKTQQNNRCAICDKEESSIHKKTGKIKDLAVDHCHKTGKIRGLLCWQCNTSLGKFEDSIELLTNAINYLKK
jgi:hypothetical protein